MITVSFDDKVKIGLQYALETLHGCSPFGQEKIRKLRFYTPTEREALDTELGNVERCAKAAGELKETYDKIINIARSEKAVTDGVSFDLMYVNGDLQRQYAFMRKAGSEVILVVANFDSAAAIANVTIPAHAFDYLGLKEKNAQTTDLLSDSKVRITLKRDAAATVCVDPLSVAILKFKA